MLSKRESILWMVAQRGMCDTAHSDIIRVTRVFLTKKYKMQTPCHRGLVLHLVVYCVN